MCDLGLRAGRRRRHRQHAAITGHGSSSEAIGRLGGASGARAAGRCRRVTSQERKSGDCPAAVEPLAARRPRRNAAPFRRRMTLGNTAG